MSSSTSDIPTRPLAPSRKSSSHRSTISQHRTEVKINVYDLLPPGTLSSVLWTLGGSLLHSGVVIKDREYAYGGHDRAGVSGVYWTRPGLEPPGGTYRCSILHGFSFRSEEQLDEIIHEVSQKFQGTSYNLLTKNCNHFTSHLCERLTSKPAPGWLNRAASIGLALPCVVPREWIAPPDHDTADGELLDEDDEDADEHSAMLRRDRRRSPSPDDYDDDDWEDGIETTSEIPQRGTHALERDDRWKLVSVRDTSNRELPVSERAPMPRRT
ncbi:PPPDE putative peptidase domain-containing protein [Lineolata rhizophorae]|uniref:PPPDE putative peptidase domain-containing protein n=1 Tax=Lineolata rhizophorae TaxID=578093 RepID=A0A6A6PAW4_9PEZI|nr:PPPDE putative peptidase domain-containing protein [Lineolata rhizophorae]